MTNSPEMRAPDQVAVEVAVRRTRPQTFDALTMDMCDPANVEAAGRRVSEYGTLAYIATVQQQINAALRQVPDAEQGVLVGVTFVKADVMVVGRIDDANKPAADGPYVWLMIDPKDGKVINYSVPVASVEALRAPTQDRG